MSLHTLANHLQDAGRGDDKVLVHMTPREVGGLEAIARAHGGTLTTNPHTGLPEAGFLDSILPMIAGAALTATGIGAPMAALLVGGAGALATGDVTKGLMMGLGAYGGAGIGESLAEAGASNAASQMSQGLQTNIAPVDVGANVFNSAGTELGSNLAANSGASLQNAIMNGGQPITQGAGQLAQGMGQTSQGVLTGAQQFPEAQAWGEWANSAPGQLAKNQAAPTFGSTMSAMGEGAKNTFSSFDNAKNFAMNNKMNLAMAAAPGLYSAMNPEPVNFTGTGGDSKGQIRPWKYDSTLNEAAFAPTTSSAERSFYLNEPRFTPAKEGGIMSLAVGGPIEDMSAQNAVGSNMMYPQSQLHPAIYSNPMVQRPMPNDVINQGIDTSVDPYTGQEKFAFGGSTALKAEPEEAARPTSTFSYDPTSQEFTETITTPPSAADMDAYNMGRSPGFGGMMGGGLRSPGMGGINFGGLQNLFMQRGLAQLQPPQPTVTKKVTGGIMPQKAMALGGSTGGYDLGGYSDGGRLLKGPGDGVSDSIPATIGGRQPARLADGEFVVPARIVSELGNGSTEAGARKLYAMMDRIQKNRKKSVGKDKVAVNSKSDKYLPA